MLFLRIDVTCLRFQMQRLQTTKKISESKSLYRTLTGRNGGGEAVHSSVIGILPGILPPSDVSQPSAPAHFRSLLLRINQLHRGFTRFPDLLVTNCSCSILRPPTHVLKNDLQRRTDGEDCEREGGEGQGTCRELLSSSAVTG